MKRRLTAARQHAGARHILAHVAEDLMRYLHGTGLSGPQLHALLYIHHAGECNVSEISALSGSSAAAGSQLVDRLVRQGYVERVEDQSNRRIKRLRLTNEGLALVNKGMDSGTFLAGLMTHLTPHQRKVVHAALGYLVEAASHPHGREGIKQRA